MKYAPKGIHAIVDGRDADRDRLDDLSFLSRTLRDELTRAGANVLRIASHAFVPQGVTVIALLAESHASIHTYPEHGVYMIDVFTCGSVDAGVPASAIAHAIGGEFELHTIERGQKKTPPPG